ncbi:hypothetical protein [Mesorhizobium sp. INR15]|uniref:hypothetical protein n=1 Tax=Mesorhizobium sp. INR15 TaxID=2654248 RepID=UPI00189677DA|nr:hypothetical protein [Mesorhizobium sp. INR15]QPC91590.1 hypothetical protein GA829_13790 [Mesorhizobium sp. INR15]
MAMHKHPLGPLAPENLGHGQFHLGRLSANFTLEILKSSPQTNVVRGLSLEDAQYGLLPVEKALASAA